MDPKPADVCTGDLAAAIAELCSTHDVECALNALLFNVAAICAETDDPRDVGMGVIASFVDILDDQIEGIPAESIIDLPGDPN